MTHTDHWTRYAATGPMHGSSIGKWVGAEEAQAEYAALTARVAELEAALRDMAAQCATIARLDSCGEKEFLNGLAQVMIRTIAKVQQ